jgi:hypothetical protein
MENIGNEEGQELHICIKDVDKLEVLEWEEDGEIIGFHVVYKLKTGNELHIHKLVA